MDFSFTPKTEIQHWRHELGQVVISPFTRMLFTQQCSAQFRDHLQIAFLRSEIFSEFNRYGVNYSQWLHSRSYSPLSLFAWFSTVVQLSKIDSIACLFVARTNHLHQLHHLCFSFVASFQMEHDLLSLQ